MAVTQTPIGVKNILDFGAVGDGVVDDLPAFVKANTHCSLTGDALYIPKGKFRITAQWVMGVKYVSDEDMLAYGSDSIAAAAPSYNATAFNQAVLAKRYNVYGDGSQSIIFADFTPDVLTAAIRIGFVSFQSADNLQNGYISNLGIYGAGTSVEWGVSNKLAGITMHLIALYKVSQINFVNLEEGIIAHSCYWSRFEGLNSNFCVTGFRFFQANASVISNNLAQYCAMGYHFTGQGVTIECPNTQNCKVDWYIPTCDNLKISGGYLENAYVDHTDYGIKIGNPALTGNAVFIDINNVHLTRLGGKGLRIYGTVNYVFFNTVRLYSTEALQTTTGRIMQVNCDLGFTPAENISMYDVDIKVRDIAATSVTVPTLNSTTINNAVNINTTNLFANGEVVFNNSGQGVNYPGWLAYVASSKYYIRDLTNSLMAMILTPGPSGEGTVGFDGGIGTGAPASGTADVWRLGSTQVDDGEGATRYVQIQVGSETIILTGKIL